MVVFRHFTYGATRFVAYRQPKFRPEEHPTDGLYNTFPCTTRTFGRTQHPFPIPVTFDVRPVFCIQEQSQDVVQRVCRYFLLIFRFHSKHGRHGTLRIQCGHRQFGDVLFCGLRLDPRDLEPTKPIRLLQLAVEICLDDCPCAVCLSLPLHQPGNVRLEPVAFFL